LLRCLIFGAAFGFTAVLLAYFAWEHLISYEPETLYAQGDILDAYENTAIDCMYDEHIYKLNYASRPEVVTITISAAGDTTLGGDRRWAGYHAFMREYDENGAEWFLSNVAQIFYESDLSIVNLEGALTDITYPHMDKRFIFRGPMSFAQILVYGNIDVVSLANNHTIDFFERGMNDTRQALTDHGVAYFGNEHNTVMEINGIYVGLFGFSIWNDSVWNQNRITAAIRDLEARGAQLIIAYFHWGIERDNWPTQYQVYIGRHTIRQGAHLVLGAHPHVLQGIDTYEGWNIVYSLADFSFGGNAGFEESYDMHTMIFQQTFTFIDGVLQEINKTNIIPAFMSSVRHRNDFRPTVAEGDDAEYILGRIRRYSDFENRP